MLLQFVVENHRSFRDRAVLSMLAVPDAEHPPGLVVDGPDGLRVLRLAALYGANGSGKSNLVHALATMMTAVVVGTRGDQPLPVVPFRFDGARAQAPSHFAVEVAVEGARYSYGFEATATKVHAEWLYRVGPEGQEETLFEREAGAKGPRIELGQGLARDGGRRAFLGFVAQGTRQNQLFLAEAGERNVVELAPIREVFENLACVEPGGSYRSILSLPSHLDEIREVVGRLLEQAGTGISEVRVREQTVRDAPASLDGSDTMSRLDAVHRTPDGAEFTLDMDQESDGTQRLAFLAPVFYVMENHEKDQLFVIDELERSLHPLLSRHLIRRFLEFEGEHATQLIFTTHDTALLDARPDGRLVSRDAIWLVEKDPRGGSVLYPLSDVDKGQVDAVEAQGQGLERGYLQGRFGAIPFLGADGWDEEPG